MWGAKTKIMKAFYNTSKANKFAFVVNTTAYLIENDVIVKSYPAINLPKWYEETEISNNFSELVAKYNQQRAIEKAKKDAEIAEAECFKRINTIANLRNLALWKAGIIEAFVIRTCEEYNNDKNFAPDFIETKLVFGIENAEEIFNNHSLDLPSENQKYAVIEILESYLNFTKDEKAEIRDCEQLKALILEHADVKERREEAESIEGKDYVVTTYKYGNFNRNIGYEIDKIRDWNGWIGNSYYSKQTTTADLAPNQYAISQTELEESDDEDLVNAAIKAGYLD